MSKKEKIGARVRGKNSTVWKRIRRKYMRKLHVSFEKLLDRAGGIEVDPIDETNLKNELDDLRHSGMSFIKSKLDAPGLDNQLKLAEIHQKYTQIEKDKAEIRKLNAETRKTHAEAFQEELAGFMKSIGMARALFLQGDVEGEEMLMFVKELEQLEEGAEVLKAIEEGEGE